MIGKSVPRRDGRPKVLGEVRYAADTNMPAMLHGVTVRSKVPRAILRGIRFGEGVPWDEFTIVTAADIPGRNRVSGHVLDQPFLVGIGEEIAHPDQAVVLLAHPDRYLAEKARKAVVLEIEERQPVLDIESSMDMVQVIHGKDNILKEYRIGRGNPDAMWSRAAHVIEGEYRTGAQEHVYLETNGVLAWIDEERGTPQVVACGSIQCPYYVHAALMLLFNLPAEQVRVTALELGGGFGGKEDYPSVISGHAALLAWKSGRPVKLIYDREEDMACTTKRHPSRTPLQDRLRRAREVPGHRHGRRLRRRRLRDDLPRGDHAGLSGLGRRLPHPPRAHPGPGHGHEHGAAGGRSAGSGAPRPSSPWSATWTPAPCGWASTPSSCGAGTS